MSYESEFETVKLIRQSTAETRAVDAFALSLIKAERQLRKIFTYLIFQNLVFSCADINALRNTLFNNRRVYFKGFIQGIDVIISPKSVETLVGKDYSRLFERVSVAIDYRNKIFHGQLTDKGLSRDELFKIVDEIQSWCRLLADGATEELGYDGFERNSFHKSSIPDVHLRFSHTLSSVQAYEEFIREYLQR
jgi:hypothetical protein